MTYPILLRKSEFSGKMAFYIFLQIYGFRKILTADLEKNIILYNVKQTIQNTTMFSKLFKNRTMLF